MFEIHERLREDCHVLGRFELCHLLLNRNAAVPWLVLVPEVDATDLLDLAPPSVAEILAEAYAVSRFIKHYLDWPKVNFAAIGNLVPQLHLHLVGRRPGDACWPLPVWGHLPAGPAYDGSTIGDWVGVLRKEAGLRPP